MIKQKTPIICGALVIVIISLGHFIPISTDAGVLNKESTTCIAYTSPRMHNHRVIMGGLNDYNEAKNQLLPDGASIPCGESVQLNLFLW